jgi:ATP-dependent DNA helicase RecG
MYDVLLQDDSGKIHCKFFRVPYKGFFERFKPNQPVRVIGKVASYRGQMEFSHPDIQDESASEALDSDKLIPVYPESEGLTNRQIRKLVEISLLGLKNPSKDPPAVEKYKSAVVVEPMEKMPAWIKTKFSLHDRFEALEKVHLPPTDAGLEFIEQKSPYHRRLIFEEFFWLELYLAARKVGLKREKAPAFNKKGLELVEKLRAALPFKLTAAQERAFKQISEDLAKPHPMHRMVQGDVGSGKTLVALMASLVAVENGFQAAIMAPTEILSEQHYQNAKRLLEPLGITVGLLTGSMRQSERTQTGEMLRNGMVQIIVGTHALIQDDVQFKNLGLVIIDEQHRFGVQQRDRLKKKGESPHFLVMTATPIPRTLAMTVYGDLDVSVIDELPPGRSPIVTRVTYESKRPQLMQFLAEQLEKGRQAFIVYPLVEESEKIDLKDAFSQFESLKLHFENTRFKVGLLHGKMKSDEKDDVMSRFRSGEFHVLVSTTVIEVGVDVPNANLMIIEHSERFGLSQLHQLRGRVGRGEHKSFCILMLGHAVSDESRTRTEIMEKTTDGFKIAEADLEIRGPGEFLGTRQSGLPGFKLAHLVRDVQILQEARSAAFEVLERDRNLEAPEHKWLRHELLKTHGVTALASVG